MIRFRLSTILIVVALAAVSVFIVNRFFQSDALNTAAKEGDLLKVKQLIENGTPVNGRGMHSMTPLMWACNSGNVEVIDYLIDNGASVNCHNSSGSALMWAIESGNPNAVSLLLEKKVDVNWSNDLGDTASSFAHEKGNQEIIDLLAK